MIKHSSKCRHISCTCGNQMFKVVPLFEQKCILAICPICHTRIYVAGPSEMYDSDTKENMNRAKDVTKNIVVGGV